MTIDHQKINCNNCNAATLPKIILKKLTPIRKPQPNLRTFAPRKPSNANHLTLKAYSLKLIYNPLTLNH